jgi:hypothetical protein
MTVIAWDGKTLASDRQGTSAGMRRITRKIYRVSDGLVAITGGGIHGHQLLDWFRGERNPEKWPTLKGDEVAYIMHFSTKGVFVYAGDLPPFGEPVLSPFIAFGSGRDYAMAAMHLGKTAAEAIEIANLFDVNCGMGVDTLTLDQ